MNEITDETIQSLIEVGRLAAAPTEVKNAGAVSVPYIVVGGKVTQLPELQFNEHAAAPERIKQTVTVFDPESFAAYYTLFNDENSRVFADETALKVLAVLDYHAAGDGNSPRWGQHRLLLTLRQSEEWKTWNGSNNRQLTQQQFAEFLEQNSTDIVTPNPASIREIAEDLEATVDVEFAAAQRMAGGKVNFKYTETTKTTVSGGKAVTVPDQFTLSIPVFIGGLPLQVGAFLRYRIKEQKLVFFYTLLRPEEIVRTAFDQARTQIADNLSITIINGSVG
jgi:uncharacterized protein YfdQ (DUF2303 family)